MRYLGLLALAALSCAPAKETCVQYESATTPDTIESCVEVIPGHNDMDARRVNLIITGVNYSTESLEDRTQALLGCKSSNGFLDVEPFASYAHAFNFWYQQESLSVDGESDVFKEKGVEHAQECGLKNTTIAVVADASFTSHASVSALSYVDVEKVDVARLSQLRESSTMKKDDCWNLTQECVDSPTPLCEDLRVIRGDQGQRADYYLCLMLVKDDFPFGDAALSSAYSSQIILHETGGHAIGGLKDEYLKPDELGDEEKVLENMKEYGKNCFVADSQQECEQNAPWNGPCFQGCFYAMTLAGTPIYRSTQFGIMKSYSYSSFGDYDEKLIAKGLDIFLGE